jgi:hypothetical protein
VCTKDEFEKVMPSLKTKVSNLVIKNLVDDYLFNTIENQDLQVDEISLYPSKTENLNERINALLGNLKANAEIAQKIKKVNIVDCIPSLEERLSLLPGAFDLLGDSHLNYNIFGDGASLKAKMFKFRVKKGTIVEVMGHQLTVNSFCFKAGKI